MAQRVGMSIWQIVALHVGSVIYIALVIATCHRAFKTRPGAIVLGGLAAAPFGVLFSVTVHPEAELGQHALAAIIVGAALGCTSGAVYWEPPRT